MAPKGRAAWFLHLLPRRGLTLSQRMSGVLVTWGLPIIIWQALDAQLLRYPQAWPMFLLLEVPAVALGAFVIALLEHAAYR